MNFAYPIRWLSRRARAALRRGVLSSIAVMLGASAAGATTYYVNPSGNDTNPGSQGSPWRTIAKANSALTAGDVCMITPGTYTDPIQPANNGVPGARITYLGSLSNPGAATVGPILINKAWITLKGVKTSGSINLYYTSETAKAWHDSLAYVITSGDANCQGAKDCMITRCTINGPVELLMNNFLTGPPGIASSERDTVRANTINVGTISNGKGFALRGFTQYCLVDSNRISQFFAAALGGDLAGRYLYNSYYNTFRDNSWHFEADGDLASQWAAFALRDSSSYNLFERDSMLCGVQSGYSIGGRLVNSGNAAWVGQCRNNHWKDCFYLTTGYTFNQDLLNGAILEGCVFASKRTHGLYLLGSVQNTIIRNCTIVSWDGSPMRVEGDIRLGGNQIYNNIFSADTVAACFSGRAVLFHGYATGFTENYNLFHSRSAASGVSPAGQSLYWSSSACSAPGPGTPWANLTGNDVNSTYGAPLFVDSSFATFDPHLRAGSKAIGLALGGGDAGAFPFVPAGPDVTPPATVTNLAAGQVYDHDLVLSWTAPGDDGMSGAASAYDVRWSTQPIDAANFSSATPVSPQPVPAAAGTSQSYVMMGLANGTTYYVALRARDEVNNWSGLSNVLNATTTATDQAPPASIRDLSAP